jgi:hypothetical protein
VFINGQPLFIPGRREFINDNELFINRLLSAPLQRRLAPSVVFENECHFRTGRDAVTGGLLVPGPDLMLLENRIARLVNGEQVWVDGVALGVAHTLRLFQTNPHEVSSLDGPAQP